MRNRGARGSRKRRRAILCAALLLSVMGTALVHAAAPHHAAQRHCSVCQISDALAAADACGLTGWSAPPAPALPNDGPIRPLQHAEGRLKPLRAPPSAIAA